MKNCFAPKGGIGGSMEFKDVISKRYSCKSYSEKPLESEKLKTSPSPSNRGVSRGY
jgi:hypothetical protein